MTMPRYLLLLVCLGITASTSSAFRTQTKKSTLRHSRLYLSEDLPLLGDFEDTISLSDVEDSKALLQAAAKRQKDLQNGIGKRYVCRTQKGFLNVHKEPGDPFNQVNIVNQLHDGDIVVSKGPPRGVGGWIPHDHGGWSVMMYRGFTFLELIEE